ncbi:hypothetical protein DBV15_04340 [Temnothorax longispinosus]|uniref:Uncharacterized protein n=1 Tax=Temnothorax longispinosus TaxID=300112 RepID=A0A4S2K4S1_9HYME|nr:hypothetical protein DBV15_04340 [Temnothorax longispinosus]
MTRRAFFIGGHVDRSPFPISQIARRAAIAIRTTHPRLLRRAPPLTDLTRSRSRRPRSPPRWKSALGIVRPTSRGDLFDLSTNVNLVLVFGGSSTTDRRFCFSYEGGGTEPFARVSPGISGGSSPWNLPNCGVLLRMSEVSRPPLPRCSTSEMDLARPLKSRSFLPS